ncbi:MAG: hypothetical protein LBK67_11970, partial [Coriobacteriales bacterium]|nr:hypothetical protein [Coriobacteriales bacterium]
SALGPSAEETEEFQRTARFVFGSGPFSLLTESLSAKNFKPVRAAAKTLGFTVNDLFMASLALAWYRVCGMDRVVLPCTIDMRNFIPLRALRGITNLSSDCPCLIQITPDDTLEDIMAKVVEPMKVYKQGTCAVSKSVSWEIFTRRVSFRRAKQRCQDRSVPQPLSATNVGIIDEDCVRFSNVSVRSAYLFAPAPPFLSYLIALSTFRGELTLSTSIEGDEEMKAFARSILTAMIEELMAFGSRHSAGSG